MSWSFTMNDITPDSEVPESVLADMARANSNYPLYMVAALETAKGLGIKSATFSGFIMENPYTDDIVVDVSIRGFQNSTEFNETMKDIVTRRDSHYGPAAG